MLSEQDDPNPNPMKSPVCKSDKDLIEDLTDYTSYSVDSLDLQQKEQYTELDGMATIGDTDDHIFNMVVALKDIRVLNVNSELFKLFEYNTLALLSSFHEGGVLSNVELSRFVDLIKEMVSPVDLLGKRPLLFRSIGDEICDRGLHSGISMWFMYYLQNKLNIQPRILFSNHGLYFLKLALDFIKNNYTKPESWLEYPDEMGHYVRSFLRLCDSIIEENLLPTAEFKDELSFKWLLDYYLLVVYSKNLYLIDYSEDEDGNLVIYSHAPICGKIILDVYKVLLSPGAADEYLQRIFASKNALKTAIGKINDSFSRLVVKHIAGIYSSGAADQFNLSDFISLGENTAIEAIIWRRLSDPVLTKRIFDKYGVDIDFPEFVSRNVHGHDSPINPVVSPLLQKTNDELLFFSPKHYCIDTDHGSTTPMPFLTTSGLGHCKFYNPLSSKMPFTQSPRFVYGPARAAFERSDPSTVLELVKVEAPESKI